MSCQGLGAAGPPGHTALWAELPPASGTTGQPGAWQQRAPRGGGVHPHTKEGQEPHEAGGGGLVSGSVVGGERHWGAVLPCGAQGGTEASGAVALGRALSVQPQSGTAPLLPCQLCPSP